MNKKLIENKIWNECTVEVDLSDYSSWEELRNYVEDNNLCNEEVIYYSNAIEYLSENDSSLQESMEIASDYGYIPDNLTSEVLASLLKSQNNRELFYNMEDELTEYYDSIDTE